MDNINPKCECKIMVGPDIPTIIKGFFDYWGNMILAGGVFVAIFVAWWTVWNDKKNLKLNGLNLVFQKFNDLQERKSRERVLSDYYYYLVEFGKPTDYTTSNFLDSHPKIDLVELHPDLKEDVEKVKSDFEQVAVMVKNGLVDKCAYFDAFYSSMLRCYGALSGNIEKSRDKSGTEHYTTYFEEQSKEAIEYWKEKHGGFKIKYYGQERSDFTLTRWKQMSQTMTYGIRIQQPKSRISQCAVFCDHEAMQANSYHDNLPHTIEEGGGDNFTLPKVPVESTIITIKSNGHTIKRIKYFDIEGL